MRVKFPEVEILCSGAVCYINVTSYLCYREKNKSNFRVKAFLLKNLRSMVFLECMRYILRNVLKLDRISFLFVGFIDLHFNLMFIGPCIIVIFEE